MFEVLEMSKPDGILQLAVEYAADDRPNKIDLGVGVFKNDAGDTPVLTSVKEAERRLLSGQSSKSYKGLLGDVAFNKAMAAMILTEKALDDRVSVIQTPGGSGALRLGFDLIAAANPDAVIHVPDPTWPNHIPMLTAARLAHKPYPYLDRENGTVRFEEMLAALKEVPAGDVVLLHGCCHNPSGANLSPSQWDEIADVLAANGTFAFVDLAYQGFGDGLDDDAYGVRALQAKLPEMLIAASCSKNFALYCERTGVTISVSRNAGEAERTIGKLKSLARANYSMPPDHGAAAVRTILADGDLRAQWERELDGMRGRILKLRADVAAEFRRQLNDDRFDFLEHNRGMFSLLGISDEQVAKLKEVHAVYVVGGGRINVAGLRSDTIPTFVAAVRDVL